MGETNTIYHGKLRAAVGRNQNIIYHEGTKKKLKNKKTERGRIVVCWFFSGISSLRILRAFVVKNLVKSKPITGGTRKKLQSFFFFVSGLI
ncbi:MAG: hypothetical protein L3K26_13655 [Candidatus Hydrogenedentes bacterium]|nr:hypothetical protein [Candidatus Hydrogenedentota bacterium]